MACGSVSMELESVVAKGEVISNETLLLLCFGSALLICVAAVLQ